MPRCSANCGDGHELFECIPPPESAAFAHLVRFCEQNRPLVLASLPFFAAEMAHSNGFADMLRLIRKAGGTKVYISHDRLKFNSRFSLKLTEQQHDRLVLHSDSSGLIDLPSSWGIFVSIRRAAIIAALKSRHPRGEIVRRFGVTDRYLRKLSHGLNQGAGP
ncbi:hypothetical protein AAFN88_16625 [Pelagibius sp. CAU 1746]|uniref:hypothetical protein n=1 Tax=Pelagibius sp. CAU 1746 TaxID=3140370 RepID=UPI00325A7D6C